MPEIWFFVGTKILDVFVSKAVYKLKYIISFCIYAYLNNTIINIILTSNGSPQNFLSQEFDNYSSIKYIGEVFLNLFFFSGMKRVFVSLLSLQNINQTSACIEELIV